MEKKQQQCILCCQFKMSICSCAGEDVVDLTSETPETSVVDLTNADCVVVGFRIDITNANPP